MGVRRTVADEPGWYEIRRRHGCGGAARSDPHASSLVDRIKVEVEVGDVVDVRGWPCGFQSMTAVQNGRFGAG